MEDPTLPPLEPHRNLRYRNRHAAQSLTTSGNGSIHRNETRRINALLYYPTTLGLPTYLPALSSCAALIHYTANTFRFPDKSVSAVL